MEPRITTEELAITKTLRINAGVKTSVKCNPTALAATTLTMTTADILAGGLAVTEASATTVTLPTALLLALAINAKVYQSVDFFIDNTASSASGAVTMATGSGIVVPTVTANKTVPITEVATFRIIFTGITVTSGVISAATAYLQRIAA